jgi:hypothetical protein
MANPELSAARMNYWRLFLAILLIVGAATRASAFSADGCEQQRKQYPAEWNNTSTEKRLFVCESQADRYLVKSGATDAAGRTLMSLVPFSRSNTGVIEESRENVLRIWLDKEQLGRLRAGKYFATIVRKEESCWIRGNMSEDIIFLMDNSHPPEDNPGAAGSFYNKAPRFSAIGSSYLSCDRVK